jgi:hypothetical protein
LLLRRVNYDFIRTIISSTDTTKDEKWLVLVGRPSLAASRWRALRPAPPSYFHTKKYLPLAYLFVYFYRLRFQGRMIIVQPDKNRFYPRNSPDFSPEKDPKAPGLVTYHALTAIWRLPSRFSGGDKMGMIAFYAGLFIGVLFGFLLSSLWAHSRAKPEDSVLPDPAEGYSQVDPLKP